MSQALTAAQIAAHTSRRLAKHEIWGGIVYLKGWSGAERSALQAWSRGKNPDESADIEICVRGIVDENGSPIFNGDAAAILADKDATEVFDLAMAILKHNRMGEGAKESSERNFPSAPNSFSGTVSLST